MIVRVYWPGTDPTERYEIQAEGEQFLRSWKRFEVVQDIHKADVAVIVVVRPTVVGPGFWQRVAANWMASSSAYCTGAIESGISCYSNPGNQVAAARLLMPSTVYEGSILLFDPKEILEDMASNAAILEGKATPIMAALASNHGGRKPLIGAAKELRKAIDGAGKASASASPPR